MLIDANDQSAFAVVGVVTNYASAFSLLVSYEFVEFDDVTVKAAYFDNATLEPGD
jgi:hypothetical protein